MAENVLVGKTILQLDPLTGTIDRAKSFIEIHVIGQLASQKVPLNDAALRGLSAKEVVQLTHPEIVSDQDFIDFIKGAKGEKGIDGNNGKTAYELALQQGFIGTIDAWLASLIGAKGNVGEKGEKGEAGIDGKTAYQLAQADGFAGTLTEWLASLKGKDGSDGKIGTDGKDGLDGKDGTNGNDGKDGTNGSNGKSAFELAVQGGYAGTLVEWLASLKGIDGKDGKSAYALALAGGYVGTEQEWLTSLIGAKGADGRSAYTAALEGGFVGTEPEWLASLIGAKGKSAYQSALDEGFVGTQAEWVFSLKGAKGDKGDPGASAVAGELIGVLSAVEDLPPIAEYKQADYFFIGTHIYMNVNGEWLDLGDFSGVPGLDGTGFVVLGELGSTSLLPAAGERSGDAWLIGKSMYVWNGARWQEQGNQGLKGDKGDKGDTGKSALDIIREGNPTVTTPEAMAAFLRGPQGEQGEQGDAAVSFTTEGKVNAVGELPAVGTQGHGYIVGAIEGQYDYWVWINGAWFNMGNNVGPVGPKGNQGDRGPQGTKGDTGISLVFKGIVQGVAGLPDATTVPENTMYFVQHPSNPVDADNGKLELFIRVNYGDPFVVGDIRRWVSGGNVRGARGADGKQGLPGPVVNAKGERATEAELPATGNVAGDGFIVADYLWIYGSDGWVRMGQWRGIAGTNGRAGVDGKSAYQAAVAAGYQGSEEAWLASLKGKDGVSFAYIGHFNTVGELPAGNQSGKSATVGSNPTKLYLYGNGVWNDAGAAGAKGEKGDTGIQGVAGKTAFEVAVANGYLGSEAQWLTSLKGLAGLSAFQAAVNNGFVGTEAEWVISLHGKDGLTAYELAVLAGFVGTQAEWVASLTAKGLNFIGDFPDVGSLPAGIQSQVATVAGHVYIHDTTQWVDVGPIASGPKGDKGDKGNTGENGVDGKSAYELAVQGGFVGDLAAWIASLHGATGATGKSIYQDSVDRGLFQGTFEEFLARQKGDSGASAYEEALELGAVPAGTTFVEFLATLEGPEGPKGETGGTGPAIRIIGTVATVGELPATGVDGTGYAIPDSASPGTYNCYIWVTTPSAQWFNLGHIVGAKGDKGDQGVRGLQGLRGETGVKGDQGSLWIVLARDPQPLDGRIDDYYLNSASLEFFRKTSSATWASLGHMGGGNLFSPNSDGKTKVMKDGQWVNLSLADTIPDDTKAYMLKAGVWSDLALVNTIPADTGTYVLKGGVWTRFDTYTLKALVATTTVDFNLGRVFRITNTANATVALTNIPAADRATTVVVKVYGKVGSYQWTLPSGSIRWFDGAAPVFTNDITTIVFTWDGQEMTGSVPN